MKPEYTEVDRCAALFQIVQRRGCKTWRDFEQELSRFIVFCGRSPMVSKFVAMIACVFTMAMVNTKVFNSNIRI